MPTAFTSAKNPNRVAVIGGGAAGMMAAVQCASMGAQTCLFEKNEKLGKKLYITGKGRCNFTNACPPDEFIRQISRNGRFAYGAVSRFSPQDMMDFLESAHCPVKIERGKRAFPVSDKASDVTRAFQRALEEAGAEVHLNTKVVSIRDRDDGTGRRKVAGILLEGDRFLPFDAVIVATGGLSYPTTGSTGDGYEFARLLGHTVTPCSPSLTGVETMEPWPKDLQGLSLKNIALTLFDGNRKRYSQIGEMLFTHFGISGPLVLDISSILSGREMRGCRIELDLKPGLTQERIQEKLTSLFSSGGGQQVRTVTGSMFPHRFNETFLSLCGVRPDKKCAQVTSSERNALAMTMKHLSLTPFSLRSFNEAIVTRGGVDTRQISASTMASKLVDGLYFAGEVIDIDALTGGFNLQIAFSTGHLAGVSAAAQAGQGSCSADQG